MDKWVKEDAFGKWINYEAYEEIQKELEKSIQIRSSIAYDFVVEKDLAEVLIEENKKLKDDIQFLKTLSGDEKTRVVIRGYRLANKDLEIALTKVIKHIYSSYENKKDFFEQWGNEYELTNGLDILKED